MALVEENRQNGDYDDAYYAYQGYLENHPENIGEKFGGENMKKRIILNVLVAVICIWGMTACSNTKNRDVEISPQKLQDANSNCINIETHEIVMKSESEGTVELTVEIPDYEVLFKQAYKSEDPDGYMLQALESENYDSCERIVIAKVTVENGEQVVHTDEALKELLEQEFSNAINILMEDVN